MKQYLAFLCVWMSVASLAYGEVDEARKTAILTAQDETILIETLQTPGMTDDDVFMKDIACKQLARIGTEKAVPALIPMLSDAKLNEFARFALEAMPFTAAEDALLEAAPTLEGLPQVGVINSLGTRKAVRAVPVLAKIEKRASLSPETDAAICLALGRIATDEAVAILLAKGQGTEKASAALGDALLEAAMACEKTNRNVLAAQVYRTMGQPAFSEVLRNAAWMHAILLERLDPEAVKKAWDGTETSLLWKTLLAENEAMFLLGLRALHETATEQGEALTAEVLERIAEFSPTRQAQVLGALAQRKEKASQKLVFSVLIQACKSKDFVVHLAAIQGLQYVGYVEPMTTIYAINRSTPRTDATERKLMLDAMTATMVALPGTDVDKWVEGVLRLDGLAKSPEQDAVCSILKVVNLRRIQSVASDLVQIANTPSIASEVRDAALSALAELVTLDNLDLLVKALDGEKDDKKVSNILLSACTRLPREACAAKVVEMFQAAPTSEEKAKLLTLLKQIGGQTALECVVSACWNDETANAATAVLGNWNTPDDMPGVAAAALKLAKEAKEERFRIRAIRSFIRVPRQFELPLATKLEMCRTAFDTAWRKEDKLLIFEVFRRNIDVASAQAAWSYVGDADYREAACEAIVAIATKFKGQSPELKAVLQNVSETSQNQSVVTAAKEIMARL